MTLSVEDGCFAYRRSSGPLLRHIHFSADPGDIVAILGPNGAGKTTLLRCMMGFLRWDSGRSCLDGKDIRSVPGERLWRTIAYVPQAKNTVVSYTVGQMVLLGRSSHFGMLASPAAEDVEKAEEVMDRLDIWRLREKKCSQISGGELQMTLIARALVSEPSILILDEPESNLDFRNQLLILRTMSVLAAGGMSCIFNTHYPAHALQRANKALLLGRQHEPVFGDVHDVVTERNIERAFGVKAVIGEIETPGNILQDVIPLSIAKGAADEAGPDDAPETPEPTLAVVAVIADDNRTAEKINGILHEYGRFIVGRMGMPYPDRRVYIINVTLDAPADVVNALARRLNILPGVSVKTTFRPEPCGRRGDAEKPRPDISNRE